MNEVTITVNVSTRDEPVIFRCAPADAESVCFLACKHLNVTSLASNIFGLRERNSDYFLAGNSPIAKPVNLDLRIRFKIPNLIRLKQIDPMAYHYFFYQARKDVLDNNVPEIIYSKHKEELLGLGITDMYRVMIERNIPCQIIMKDYKKYIPREVTKKHKMFTKIPIYSTLSDLKKKQVSASYVVKEYLKQLELLAPNYLSEEYDVQIQIENSVFRSKLHVMPFHKEQPGLRLYSEKQKEWSHLCTIDDLCFMSMGVENTIEISRKNGIPVYLVFSARSHMFSFVSVCDGYYRLMIKWTFNICRAVTSPHLQFLHSIKCHGPVGGQFSYHKLEEKRSNKPGCFIIRQCEQQYDIYYIDVCVKNSKKPRTYKIRKDKNDFVLINNNKEFVYKNIPELIAAYKNPEEPLFLQERLPPSDYEKSQLLLCEPSTHNIASNINHEDIEKLLSINKGPRCIDTKDLLIYEGTKVKSSINACFYKARWYITEGKKMDVMMKMLNNDAADAILKEFINQTGQWAFLKSPALVRLYGIMLKSPVAMIMEYLHLGPLDVYLREGKSNIKISEIVQASASLATALWYLAEHGIVHGNIRCHKLLVSSHDRFQFSVKLSIQGLQTTYTDQDVHWIPVEYFRNKSLVFYSPTSDIWAFATTLWEIFSYGENPSNVKQPLTSQNYLCGSRLNKPSKCPEEIYTIMRGCWHADPHSRCRPQSIMRDVNHLNCQVYNVRHTYTTIESKTPKNDLDLLVPEIEENNFMFNSDQSPLIDENKSIITDDTISFDSSSNHTNSENDNRISTCQSIVQSDEYNVIMQGIIGKGHYGLVFRGTWLKDGCEPRFVAVKKLISNSSSQQEDFDQEINIAKTLKHRNIVEILGVVYNPEILLIMEFVPLGSLKSYLNMHQSDITQLQLLIYAVDVARGMEYLETKHVVHRDLAARNILVMSKSHVKISDFGLARKMENGDYYLLKSDRELPFDRYAPESRTNGKFSTKGDVWSYGVTMWEMFSFGADPPTMKPNVSQERLSRYLPKPDFSPNSVYESLMTACWKFLPADRPSFTQLLSSGERLLKDWN